MARGIKALGDHGINAGFDLSLGLSSAADQTPDLAAALMCGIQKESRAAEARGDDGYTLFE